LKYGVLPGHDPRFEPRIIARWEQLFLSTVRSTADFDLVGRPFQVETARRIGIDVVKNLDLDADCDEPFVSKKCKKTRKLGPGRLEACHARLTVYCGKQGAE
jgi:hypothetical protein